MNDTSVESPNGDFEMVNPKNLALCARQALEEFAENRLKRARMKELHRTLDLMLAGNNFQKSFSFWSGYGEKFRVGTKELKPLKKFFSDKCKKLGYFARGGGTKGRLGDIQDVRNLLLVVSGQEPELMWTSPIQPRPHSPRRRAA